MTDVATEIHNWLATPLGHSLMATETRVIADALGTVFGFQALQIGAWGPPAQFLDSSQTLRNAMVAPTPMPGATLVSDPSRLAVATDSVDSVILPHTLETHADPHQVLREVQRILVGDGHVAILGFNPYGLWGLRRLLGRDRFPAGIGRYVSERRLRDWVSLLGLEVVGARRYYYRLPVNNLTLQNRMLRMEASGSRYWSRLSGAYLLRARKRVYTIRPIRPLPVRRRRVGVAMPEPSSRICA